MSNLLIDKDNGILFGLDYSKTKKAQEMILSL